MPWKVEKRGDKYCLVKITTGETEWCHESKKHVIAGMRAKYASESKSPKKS